MSKSRGTFINARTYLKHLNPEYLRYYFAAKTSGGIDDLDLNLDDFIKRVNSDVIGKVVNIASRCAGFINKQFDNQLASTSKNKLLTDFSLAKDTIAGHYENGDYGKALREIMSLADKANQYINELKPWILIKDPKNRDLVQQICSDGLNFYRMLVIYLKPVLPILAEKTEAFLGISDLTWSDLDTKLKGITINKFKPLMTRIEPEKVGAVISDSTPNETAKKKASALNNVPALPQIEFSDFAKVDLRIVKIVNAENVEGADKLIKLTLDLGDNTTQSVFAGIKAAYTPIDLIGKLTVMVANLAPRKMKFGISEGMVLAAGPGGNEIYLLEPDAGAQQGMKVG